MSFFADIWGKIVAAGIILGALLAMVLRVFSAGKSAGQDEVIAETARAANEYEGNAAEARRAGEIREREVKNEDKPADYDRYR